MNKQILEGWSLLLRLLEWVSMVPTILPKNRNTWWFKTSRWASPSMDKAIMRVCRKFKHTLLLARSVDMIHHWLMQATCTLWTLRLGTTLNSSLLEPTWIQRMRTKITLNQPTPHLAIQAKFTVRSPTLGHKVSSMLKRNYWRITHLQCQSCVNLKQESLQSRKLHWPRLLATSSPRSTTLRTSYGMLKWTKARSPSVSWTPTSACRQELQSEFSKSSLLSFNLSRSTRKRMKTISVKASTTSNIRSQRQSSSKPSKRLKMVSAPTQKTLSCELSQISTSR